jgi:hypothetical protein
MKNIAEDVEKLDVYARKLWGQESRSEQRKMDPFSTYYTSTTSYNWFGFLERINECIEAPTWSQIKSFVEYYCKEKRVDHSSYILLYDNLEKEGYSSVFKTTAMHAFYLRDANQLGTIGTFYRVIIDFFDKK